MIGQEKLLNQINRMVGQGFPRFVIIAGNKNSGKKLIAKEIARKLDAHLIQSEIKVDEVREIINLSYRQVNPTVYLLPDTDKMSISAKNALLKITEEPPRRAYFIMTLEDAGNTLATLRSRGTILNIDPYTPDELLEYSEIKGYDLNEEEAEIVSNICTVPGEVDVLMRYDVLDFYKFIKTVVDNIGIVNGANAFKIGTRLNYKADDGGWDITLFMRAVMFIYRQKMIENPLSQYKESIRITSKYLSQLNITGIHKPSTIDMWILEMRAVNQVIEEEQ